MISPPRVPPHRCTYLFHLVHHGLDHSLLWEGLLLLVPMPICVPSLLDCPNRNSSSLLTRRVGSRRHSWKATSFTPSSWVVRGRCLLLAMCPPWMVVNLQIAPPSSCPTQNGGRGGPNWLCVLMVRVYFKALPGGCRQNRRGDYIYCPGGLTFAIIVICNL